jgi:hypothetical protein
MVERSTGALWPVDVMRRRIFFESVNLGATSIAFAMSDNFAMPLEKTLLSSFVAMWTKPVKRFTGCLGWVE